MWRAAGDHRVRGPRPQPRDLPGGAEWQATRPHLYGVRAAEVLRDAPGQGVHARAAALTGMGLRVLRRRTHGRRARAPSAGKARRGARRLHPHGAFGRLPLRPAAAASYRLVTPLGQPPSPFPPCSFGSFSFPCCGSEGSVVVVVGASDKSASSAAAADRMSAACSSEIWSRRWRRDTSARRLVSSTRAASGAYVCRALRTASTRDSRVRRLPADRSGPPLPPHPASVTSTTSAAAVVASRLIAGSTPRAVAALVRDAAGAARRRTMLRTVTPVWT